jgi:hypothetical protein
MPGNSNSVLKTVEVPLTENEVRTLKQHKCPNCLSEKSVDENLEVSRNPFWFDEVKFYSYCDKCGHNYSHVFTERYITHFISFNEKGEKVYTCQEKTLRTANTKKNEQNLRNEEGNI